MLACLLAPWLTGCQITYLAKSAYSQLNLLRRRVPLEEALRDPHLTDEQKRKLRLAQAARLFAETELGLKPTKNYSSYVQLDRPYVTYVVSAAPKDELKHHLWRYPIVGSMPYKGFFNPDDAAQEASALATEGLDVYIRGVSAYSTLGWFRDPILSSMLSYRDFDLVNTIIHETVHATIFIKSEADFNERLATFIGNKGTTLFYERNEGATGPTLADMIKDQNDDHLFSEFISRELDSLEKWYETRKAVGGPITEEERKARFAEIQTRFRETIRSRLSLPDSFKGFETADLNNARLLTYRLYVQDLDEFERVFAKLGGDFRRMVEFCKSLEREADPKARLAREAQPVTL